MRQDEGASEEDQDREREEIPGSDERPASVGHVVRRMELARAATGIRHDALFEHFQLGAETRSPPAGVAADRTSLTLQPLTPWGEKHRCILHSGPGAGRKVLSPPPGALTF